MDEYLEVNRAFWNQRTSVHVNSRFYDVPGFLRGNNSLRAIDLHDVGPIAGKTLLHLQCHFGLDTLSWARLGAGVTGVDISDVSINQARSLAAQAGLEAEFVCCDVLTADRQLGSTYDVVYTSWGALLWLPDLAAWAQTVYRLVRNGGVAHVIEFHPVIYMIDGGEWKYDYFNRRTYDEVSQGTYTDGDDAMLPLRSVSWNHSASDIIQAMLDGGFQLELIREYDYSPYGCFENMVEDRPGEWVYQDYGRALPYAISLKFRKPQ